MARGQFLIAVFFLLGCAGSYTKKVRATEEAFYNGDIDGAVSQITPLAQDSSARDRLLFYMEAGLIYHTKGDLKTSTEIFTRADEMAEHEFIAELLRRSDCALLLDVNNVYVNSVNHGFDARTFIDAIPADRVRQIHLAGHSQADGFLVDTHDAPVCPAVWALYEHTLRRAGRLIPTIIEWDQDIPPVDEVLDEADRARAVAERALGRAEVA